jgi:O-antigen ligase
VFASLGRGAIIALLMAGTPQAWRFLRGLLRQNGGAAYLKLMFGGLVLLVAVFALALPGLQQRAETGVSYNAETRTLEKSAGSGRTDAWHSFYKLAEENLAFGRGMGAGPIAKIPQQGFTAQHNEYLRLLLELGYVGGLLVLFSMIIVLWRLVRSAPAVVRPDAIALVLAFAVYSATDNTVTARHLAVALLGTLAIGVAPSWGRSPAVPHEDETQDELALGLDGGPDEPVPAGPGSRRLRPGYAS